VAELPGHGRGGAVQGAALLAERAPELDIAELWRRYAAVVEREQRALLHPAL
jgi:hypothetical protein